MRTISIFFLTLVVFAGFVTSASATASLSVGTISYDTIVVKDESITITSSVTASSVSGTLTVDATLTDNSGLFTIPTATQQLQFTTDNTQSVTWTITASSTGTNAAPFSVRAVGDDGGTTASGTSSTVLNVKDRPVLSVTASKSVSTVATGGNITLGYLVSNSASTGAADATNVVVNLTLPGGFSLTSGTSSYSLGSISAQGSTSGTWVVTADSPSTTNTFTMSVTSTIPGGTVSTTTSVSASTSGSGSTSSSGGGGGGGGGGGISGENYLNIELKEKYDEKIYKDIITSYKFKNASSPVMFVNITGNTNTGMINTALELLKARSSLVNVTAPGVVYKNFNIWVGTSGFVSTKNIQAASIGFRVLNSWLTDNGIGATDIRLVRWDGTNWVQLETAQNSKDSTYTYFEAKTSAFANLAITGLKGDIVPTATPELQASQQVTAIEETPADTRKKDTPGFEFALSAAVLSMLYLLVRSRR
ncbi:MAG: PGF-pre-PGF domain-containing protein [Candidatus Methanoperedens sp.]|nr:PGF-pre-PGF domain-containing protein [Candidatus Methanoperedens sp.]